LHDRTRLGERNLIYRPFAEAASARLIGTHDQRAVRLQRVFDDGPVVEKKRQLVFGAKPVVPVMSMSAVAPDPAIVSLMLDLVAGREHRFGPIVLWLRPTLSRHDAGEGSIISRDRTRGVSDSDRRWMNSVDYANKTRF
jgi:hypothetical protein